MVGGPSPDPLSRWSQMLTRLGVSLVTKRLQATNRNNPSKMQEWSLE